MGTKNWIYLKYQELSADVRLKNNLRPYTKDRLDCVSAYIPEEKLRGLDHFINPQGQLYLNKAPSRTMSKAAHQRQAAYTLTNKKINITSLFVDFPEYPQYAYGNPPSTERVGIKKDRLNPLFKFRNDLYLFIINSDYTKLEFIIIPSQKNVWNLYYQKLINGELNHAIQLIKANASTFFDYGL